MLHTTQSKELGDTFWGYVEHKVTGPQGPKGVANGETQNHELIIVVVMCLPYD